MCVPCRPITGSVQKLVPRLRAEGTPLALAEKQRYYYRSIDIDLLEAALANGVLVADPPAAAPIDFQGWLARENDHALRNHDIVHAAQDERFHDNLLQSLDDALTPRNSDVSMVPIFRRMNS